MVDESGVGVDKGCSEAEVGRCEYRSEEEFPATGRLSRDGKRWLWHLDDCGFRCSYGSISFREGEGGNVEQQKSADQISPIVSFWPFSTP
jgi:hypothetical protein